MKTFDVYRSLLFTPGVERRRMEKALASGVDAVIFDLEDGVAASRKEEARAGIRAFLAELPAERPPIFVRVNAPSTGLLAADVAAVCHPALTGVMIPKVESTAEIAAVAAELERHEAPGSSPLELIIMIETARGLRLAYELATASPRISRLAFGAVDYSLDLGVNLTDTGEELVYAQSKLVVDSRAAGLLPPLDTIWLYVRDMAGLEATARRARRLGMGGKFLIHPDQIAPTNAIFSPSEAEVQWAHKMVAAFREMERSGRGVAALDGQLVERPIYLRALNILRLANAQEEDR